MPRLGAELWNCSRHCSAVSASVVPNGTDHFAHDLLRTLPLKCNEFCIIKPSRGCEGEAGDDRLILPRSSFSIISKSEGLWKLLQGFSPQSISKVHAMQSRQLGTLFRLGLADPVIIGHLCLKLQVVPHHR